MIKPPITYEDFGPFTSEVLTLGPDNGTQDQSNWVALTTLKEVPLGREVK